MVVTMQETFKVGLDHYLKPSVEFSEAEVQLIAEVHQIQYPPTTLHQLRLIRQWAMYEARLALMEVALRSGVVTAEAIAEHMAKWKPAEG